ncbi:MAG: hypothetical protein M3247_07365, partial [Thermoproteota archaeon]|nr:hypothetical protein [Thermoproteota archaeon]
MAISIAFFGLGIGSFVIHIQRDNITLQKKKSAVESQFAFSSRIVRFAIAYGISVPIFIFLLGYIPSDTSYIYLFYVVSSIPLFFAGACMAIIFLAMPERISKLYFADLIGAASATIILDPLLQRLGAASVLLLTSAAAVGAAAFSYYFILSRSSRNRRVKTLHYHTHPSIGKEQEEKTEAEPSNNLNPLAIITFAGLAILLTLNNTSNVHIFDIKPGVTKGLYYQLSHPSEFNHISEGWNSFSRVDVTHKINKQQVNNPPGNITDTINDRQNTNSLNTSGVSNRSVITATDDTDKDSDRELASIIIDADAATPIFRWNGSQSDVMWMQKYMDYLPYKMINANDTLVIGSGGGEDVLVALSAGVENVTAVELNPLVVSAVKHFGSQAGNIYSNNNHVHLFIDDGRRFISSTTEKFNVIVLKLVDSWAAQLAGGYALSENYLYTVEAFQQYLRHLDKDNGGMLVMTRWNFELPRLMPLIVDSLVKETGESRDSVARHIMAVEDRPGLYFGRSNDNQEYYPVLVMIKSTPFDDRQVAMVKEEAERNNAETITLAGKYIAEPYTKLFSKDNSVYNEYFSTTAASNPTIPKDNSPFYFAREQIPKQMITLLETVLSISGLLSALLVYHAKKTK